MVIDALNYCKCTEHTFVYPSELSLMLNISEDEVLQQINDNREEILKLGFKIEAPNHHNFKEVTCVTISW